LLEPLGGAGSTSRDALGGSSASGSDRALLAFGAGERPPVFQTASQPLPLIQPEPLGVPVWGGAPPDFSFIRALPADAADIQYAPLRRGSFQLPERKLPPVNGSFQLPRGNRCSS
jgi:hypothetical protein